MASTTSGQFVRFAVAGVLGMLVDIAVLYGAQALLHSGPYAGRLLSFLAAACFTWRFNRRYTFTATAAPWQEWWRYLSAMSAGALLNLGAYSAAIALLTPAPWLPALAVAIGSASGMMFNFLSAKLLVFKS